jgi:hypothetical protein
MSAASAMSLRMPAATLLMLMHWIGNDCSVAYVSIRQHTSAYVSIRQHTSAYVSMRQQTSAYVSIFEDASCGATDADALRLIEL